MTAGQTTNDSQKPIWQPGAHRVEKAALTKFRQRAAERFARDLPDYEALHAWSVSEVPDFWDLVWDFCDIRASVKGERILADTGLPGAAFSLTPGSTLLKTCCANEMTVSPFISTMKGR